MEINLSHEQMDIEAREKFLINCTTLVIWPKVTQKSPQGHDIFNAFLMHLFGSENIQMSN